MTTLLNLWDRYWFRPAPLVHLALCRIVVVAFQLFQLTHLDYLSEFRRLSELPDALYRPLPILRLLTLPVEWISAGSLAWHAWQFRPSYGLLEIVFWLTLVAGALALVGLRTSYSLIVFALGNVFMQAFLYSFNDFHHPEALMLLTLAILALSPAGAVLSVDDLRRRIKLALTKRQFVHFNLLDESSALARWPLLLVQWLFALIYLSAAISKVGSSGLEWVNGYTLQYYLLQDGLRWESHVGVWLGQHHTLVWLLSWLTILFEGTFFSVLIFPPLAWIYIPLGVAFHTGIYVTMRAPFFYYLPLYVVFIPWVSLARALSRRLRVRRVAAKPEILFDGQCPLCLRSMTVLRYFDWFNRLAFSELQQRWPNLVLSRPDLSREDCQREMHVLLPDGSVRKGFFAFREILQYLPPLWLLLIIFYLPLTSTVGPKLYRIVAARRPRLQECSFANCAIHADK
jgi:predicted DCC family thiol-disulfide oxidoreductase YuxK